MSSTQTGSRTYGNRKNGVIRHRTLSALDIEILRFITRFSLVRPHHVVGWTGASPHTIDKHLRFLKNAGLLTRTQTDVALRDTRQGNQIINTVTTVWTATTSGATAAGEWTMPGTNLTIALPAPRLSKMTTHHVLGVTDLAVWYRACGYQVTSEREILSVERESALNLPKGAKPIAKVDKPIWSVPIAGRKNHPPDIGVIHPDTGQKWAIELERATKTAVEYEQVIRAFRDAGLGQVWHVLREQATGKRLLEACTRLGVIWGPQPGPGMAASAPDGLIRFQGWLPGPHGLITPDLWDGWVPRNTPSGIPQTSPRPDLQNTWRRNAVLDRNTDEFKGGQFL